MGSPQKMCPTPNLQNLWMWLNLEKGFADVIKNLWVGFPRLLGGLCIQGYLLMKDTQMGNREEAAEVMEDRGRDWRGGAKGESRQSPGAKGKEGFSLRASRAGASSWQPCFQTSSLRNCGRIDF